MMITLKKAFRFTGIAWMATAIIAMSIGNPWVAAYMPAPVLATMSSVFFGATLGLAILTAIWSRYNLPPAIWPLAEQAAFWLALVFFLAYALYVRATAKDIAAAARMQGVCPSLDDADEDEMARAQILHRTANAGATATAWAIAAAFVAGAVAFVAAGLFLDQVPPPYGPFAILRMLLVPGMYPLAGLLAMLILVIFYFRQPPAAMVRATAQPYADARASLVAFYADALNPVPQPGVAGEAAILRDRLIGRVAATLGTPTLADARHRYAAMDSDARFGYLRLHVAQSCDAGADVALLEHIYTDPSYEVNRLTATSAAAALVSLRDPGKLDPTPAARRRLRGIQTFALIGVLFSAALVIHQAFHAWGSSRVAFVLVGALLIPIAYQFAMSFATPP